MVTSSSFNIISSIMVSLCCLTLAVAPSSQAETEQQRQENKLTAVQLETQAQAQIDTEQQQRQLESQIKDILIQEAVDVINETKYAIITLNKKQDREASAAIERAMSKISILLSRYKENALLPTDYTIEASDIAPTSLKDIYVLGKIAERSVDRKDYVNARLLLEMLRSEINVRTHHLPLTTYPEALKKTALLLEEKKTEQAIIVLQTALNTLVIIDQVAPLPIINARAFLISAQEKRTEDKDLTFNLLEAAKQELIRAKALGYLGKSEEYTNLHKAFEGLQNEVKNNKSTLASFTNIRDKLTNFLIHIFELRKFYYPSSGKQ